MERPARAARLAPRPGTAAVARTARRALWPVAVAVGLAAEAAGFGWDRPRDWVPDLLCGWALIGLGLVAWARHPESRAGALLAASGFAWFAGTFAADATYLHRGPLVHALLTFPSGRARGRAQRAAVAVGYGAALVEPVWRSEAATIALAVLLAVVAAAGHRDAVGRERRARRYARSATYALAAVLAGTALVRVAAPTQFATDATLLVYEAALIALAGALASLLERAPWDRVGVTDLVVELGGARSGSLREALARALGDPTLEVGYRLPGGGFVDASGRPLELPSGRRVTEVRRDGEVVAALVHDPAVLDDRALGDAVGAAARLAASNARLQAEVRAQLAELRASRRRLVNVADEERRRLERRLHDTAERRLEALLERLAATPDPELARIREQLEGTVADVRELAAGLHPRVLTEVGLGAALAALAGSAPVPVDLALDDAPLPPAAQTALYFVCSEALANVAKYAGASHVRIELSARDGSALLEVADDGAGGADPARGTGLRGLADRLEALGGTLAVESPPGGGTRVLASLPLTGSGSA